MKGARFLTGIVLGIVVTIAGRAAFQSWFCLDETRHHRIPIGPGPADIPKDEQEAYISLFYKNQITWQSTDGSPLFIDFEMKELHKMLNDKRPFLKMTEVGDYWRVDCDKDLCQSNDINPELEGDLGTFKCVRVKYWQQIGDKRADGWIIIKP